MAAPDAGSLASWLEQIGFLHGNPFATGEADRETELLPEFFLDSGQYHLIWGDPAAPETALVFAPRGGGKTAYRLMIERACCPADPASNVLAVLYTAFACPLRKLAAGRPLELEDHVSEILKEGWPALLRSLAGDAARAAPFPAEEVEPLARLAREYAPAALEPRALLGLLRCAVPGLAVDWRIFKADVQAGRLAQTLARSGALAHAGAGLLAALVDAGPPDPRPRELSAVEVMAEFVGLARSAGLEAVYVLVDRVDETQATAAAPEIIARLLEPMLAELDLAQMDGLAIKLFLPTAVQPALAALGTVRFDRLHTYAIRWNEKSLAGMLENRLSAFSGGRILSLSKICAPGLIESIDREIVQWADNSPRRLLRLGQLLLAAHADRPAPLPVYVAVDDWHQARTLFFQEQPPLLRVDPEEPQVMVGSHLVGLAPLEHRFLCELVQCGGWCKKEELIDRVWDTTEGVTDQAVSRLVRRIREKIEPEPGQPIYLLTEHNLGFRLRNFTPWSP